jgi:tripartite tricarboxylate transporter TctB family protein
VSELDATDLAGSAEDAPPSLPRAIGSLVFAAVGFVVFVLVLVETASFSPEAQPFPRLVAIVGMLGAALAFAQSSQTALAARRAAGATTTAAGTPTRRDLLISYLGPPAYGVMLLALGFWTASAIFLAGLLIVLGERRPVIVVSITASTLGAIYLVFEVGFGIRLPGSLLMQAFAS